MSTPAGYMATILAVAAAQLEASRRRAIEGGRTRRGGKETKAPTAPKVTKGERKKARRRAKLARRRNR